MPSETALGVNAAAMPAAAQTTRQRIGLAFQGGSFLAGAIGAGVVSGLVEARAFDRYDFRAFSGTSAGALVAAVCWRHALGNNRATLQQCMAQAPDELRAQWLDNAYGSIPNQQTGDSLKLIDHLWSTNWMYFAWKELGPVQWLHARFRDWVDEYVQPERCVQLLYDRYVKGAMSGRVLHKDKAQKAFDDDKDRRPRLVVGATRVKDSENVNITDADFFASLLQALPDHPFDEQEAEKEALKVAANYLRLGIMASGSLDVINGMTTIDEGHLAGTYLDGAWAENPPLKGLLAATVGQIWMVVVFPKRCAELPGAFAGREDRREELWQNAVVEQQLAFIRKVNLWLASGRLVADEARLKLLRGKLEGWLKSPELPEGKRLLAAFKASETDWQDRIGDSEKILKALLKPYRHVETRSIELPPEMQALTAGARLVNAPGFLLDKMELGRANVLRFLTTVR